MALISKIFSVFCIIVFISKLDFGSSMDKMMGGGGGIVYVSNNKMSRKPNDLLVISQKGCSPTIMKNTYKGKDMLIVGDCQTKKKPKKEYIPVPVPVKQYIPVPVMKKEMQMPMKMQMPMQMPMPMQMQMQMPMDMHMGMDMGMDMGMGEMHGMDTKRSVTHKTPDKKEGKEEQNEESATRSKSLEMKQKRVRQVTKAHKIN